MRSTLGTLDQQGERVSFTGSPLRQGADRPATKSAFFAIVNNKPIALSVSPPAGSVGLNTPIFFDLTILNQGGEAVELDLGLNRKATFG
jgi:hypothetical protein